MGAGFRASGWLMDEEFEDVPASDMDAASVVSGFVKKWIPGDVKAKRVPASSVQRVSKDQVGMVQMYPE
jgi:hypothetical protein